MDSNSPDSTQDPDNYLMNELIQRLEITNREEWNHYLIKYVNLVKNNKKGTEWNRYQSNFTKLITKICNLDLEL